MWQVETAIGDDWENIWEVNDVKEVFDTQGEAEEALDEFLSDQAEAFADGLMVDLYERADFRIVKVRQ